MSFSINSLGALSPATKGKLEEKLAAAEDYHVQVLNDLRVLADQGINVDSFKAELDMRSEDIKSLRNLIGSAKDDDAAGPINSQIVAVQNQLADLLRRTSLARQGLGESAQLKGLYWGIGVLAVAGAAAGLIWYGKGRHRR